ncbi:hypothetical protein V6N13_088560 [Hibiscus sabdariffa]|uniref:Transmembrane protein n=1 Tax=Hibiscus sabdariffa TaxID=183260 RepID=A0ABR2FZV1_9ROSI
MEDFSFGIGSITMMLLVVALLFLGPLGMPPVQPPPAYIGLVFAFVLIAIYVYLSHASKCVMSTISSG